MKLPTEKNERIKVLALIGVGSVAVIYGIFAGILNPIVKARKVRREGIRELTAEIEKANDLIERMERNLARNKEVLKEIVGASTEAGYILQPRLGNYLLGATEWIDRIAAESDVKLEPIREAGISQLPAGAAAAGTRALNAYTVRVSLDASLLQTIRFIRALEKSNPYICVSALTIAAKDKPAEQHSVSFEIQWPVWADPEMNTKIDDQIHDREPAGTQGVSRVTGTAPAGSNPGTP